MKPQFTYTLQDAIGRHAREIRSWRSAAQKIGANPHAKYRYPRCADYVYDRITMYRKLYPKGITEAQFQEMVDPFFARQLVLEYLLSRLERFNVLTPEEASIRLQKIEDGSNEVFAMHFGLSICERSFRVHRIAHLPYGLEFDRERAINDVITAAFGQQTLF